MHHAAGDNQHVTVEELTSSFAQEQVEAAQDLFRRTLSNWVGDLLVLRQADLLETSWPTEGGYAYRRAA